MTKISDIANNVAAQLNYQDHFESEISKVKNGLNQIQKKLNQHDPFQNNDVTLMKGFKEALTNLAASFNEVKGKPLKSLSQIGVKIKNNELNEYDKKIQIVTANIININKSVTDGATFSESEKGRLIASINRAINNIEDLQNVHDNITSNVVKSFDTWTKSVDAEKLDPKTSESLINSISLLTARFNKFQKAQDSAAAQAKAEAEVKATAEARAEKSGFSKPFNEKLNAIVAKCRENGTKITDKDIYELHGILTEIYETDKNIDAIDLTHKFNRWLSRAGVREEMEEIGFESNQTSNSLAIESFDFEMKIIPKLPKSKFRDMLIVNSHPKLGRFALTHNLFELLSEKGKDAFIAVSHKYPHILSHETREQIPFPLDHKSLEYQRYDRELKILPPEDWWKQHQDIYDLMQKELRQF